MPDPLCRVSVDELDYDLRQSEQRKPDPEDLADFYFDEWREVQDEQ